MIGCDAVVEWCAAGIRLRGIFLGDVKGDVSGLADNAVEFEVALSIINTQDADAVYGALPCVVAVGNGNLGKERVAIIVEHYCDAERVDVALYCT